MAARGGAGYLAQPGKGPTLLAGGVVSYDLTTWLTPYAGVSLINHHIVSQSEQTAPRPAEQGEQRPSRATSITGDGVAQGAIGIALGVRPHLFLELSPYAPMWDEPRDGYRSTATTLVTVALARQ
ncbi:MAG: hypothetical protein IT374_14405 [Polyangiaceae bacterium]|nr:hypothetical protein [Polyangiaceae bacterium]